jgi:ankyrin repeat protein
MPTTERFSQEVLQVVFETHLPDTRKGFGIRTERLWQSYILYRVLAEKENKPTMYTVIRRTAENLCENEGITDNTTLRAYIDALCRLATNRTSFGYKRGRGGGVRKRGGFVVPQDRFDDEAMWTKSLLVAAAYLGQKATVRRLLDAGYDPTDKIYLFGTATRAAAVQGNNEILELILSMPLSGPSYPRREYLAVFGAAQGGHLDTLNLILEPRWGPTLPFHQDLYLQKLRRKFHTNNPAVFDRIIELVRPDGKDKDLSTFLSQAVDHGYLETVSHLLDKGAAVNGDSKNPARNPLRGATLKGHTEIVKLLLRRGARPRLGWGDTLACAAKWGYLDIVRILLDHGADINESPPEELRAPPAIVSAIQLEHEEMFRFLIKRGAVLKTLDAVHFLRKRDAMVKKPDAGSQALKIAVAQALESMVELLLREGVEVEESHLFTASQHGHDEIARILRKHREMPRKNSYSALAWQNICNALTKTIHFRLAFNARTKKTHAPQKQLHSAPHTSSSPPSTVA